MGIFRRIFEAIFGKRKSKVDDTETYVSVDNQTGHRVIRPLTDEIREHIEKSTLLLRASQLYMHYWTDNLVCEDPNDQEWQNKVMFFWKAEEPFPKKSLPPAFEKFKVKHFLFEGDTSKISMQVGQAAPWFGMPGGGAKHFCELNNRRTTIPELHELGMVTYFEQVDITKKNLKVLTNREDYFFLIDERVTPFQNGHFQLDGKSIPISTAYEIGGIHLIKKSKLNA